MVNWSKFLVYLFGAMFVLGGFGTLSSGISGFIGGLLMIFGGCLLLPPSRAFIIGYLDGRTGANLGEISSTFVIVIALGAVFTGAAISPTSTTQPTADAPAVTQTPISTPTPAPTRTQTATAVPTTIVPTATATATPQTTTQSGPRTAWTVTVVDVVDGDTMDVRMPDGSIETVRLLGVDTPEGTVNEVSPDEWRNIPDSTSGRDWLVNWGDKASSYAEDRLSGEEIYIETDPEADRRGYYGRLLVYVYQSESSDTAFNKRLLDNGYARYYDSQFSKASVYSEAATQARSEEVGVWGFTGSSGGSGDSGGGSEDTSGSSVEVVSIHEDAEGNDNENLNDEYVTFENTGSSSVEMTGWTVSDEADHVYRFPSGFTLDAGESVTLYTGSGSDSETELYWGQDSAVWNNGGDTVYLEDDGGNTVDTYEYQ